MKTLQEQINETARTIATDSYSMSIGEIMNLYEDGEIDIHPEFQRAFRWEIEQKSRLIESILLGIPMPPIFVYQRAEDGVWDVIDGQQRLSTIFQFRGIYKDDTQNVQLPLKLISTKFLSQLEGIVWQSENEKDYQLTTAQRLLIKRAKIDIKLLKSTSDKNAKYDLFQRLNSGGSHLTPQEVRTCLVIMENRKTFLWLDSLRKNEDFAECLPLTDKAKSEQDDMEFVIRFIISKNFNADSMPSSLQEYFDDKIIEIARDEEFDYDKESDVFCRTFSYLRNTLGADCFRRYNKNKDLFEGAITISAFEAMAPSVGKNIDTYEKISREEFREKVIKMHENDRYNSMTARRSTDRYKALQSVGSEVFYVTAN